MAGATLIYDGQCPLCRSYARHVRLRRAAGELTLIDARGGGAEVEAVLAMGFNLNDGMVLKIDEAFHHGADCLNRLALMSSRSDLFNRVSFLAFRTPTVSRLVYPLLRSGRAVLLKILGRPPLAF